MSLRYSLVCFLLLYSHIASGSLLWRFQYLISRHSCPPTNECEFPPITDSNYECTSDIACGNGFSCCPNSCFTHKVCTKRPEVHDDFISSFCPSVGNKCTTQFSKRVYTKLECMSHDDCLPNRICCEDPCVDHKICKQYYEDDDHHTWNDYGGNNNSITLLYRMLYPSPYNYCPKKGECSSPKQTNENYMCFDNADCASGLVCCSHECYHHKICTSPVDPDGTYFDSNDMYDVIDQSINYDGSTTTLGRLLDNYHCPALTSCSKDPIIDKNFECTQDEDCTIDAKCCPHSCFHHSVCQHPVDVYGNKFDKTHIMHQTSDSQMELECPVLDHCSLSEENVEHPRCHDDNGCDDGEKCCSHPCVFHKVCLKGTNKSEKEEIREIFTGCPTNITCPLSTEAIDNAKCSSDDDCPDFWTCCPGICSPHSICILSIDDAEEQPSEEIIESIESVSYCPKDQICPFNEESLENAKCSSDDDCPEFWKCCPGVCSQPICVLPFDDEDYSEEVIEDVEKSKDTILESDTITESGGENIGDVEESKDTSTDSEDHLTCPTKQFCRMSYDPEEKLECDSDEDCSDGFKCCIDICDQRFVCTEAILKNHTFVPENSNYEAVPEVSDDDDKQISENYDYEQKLEEGEEENGGVEEEENGGVEEVEENVEVGEEVEEKQDHTLKKSKCPTFEYCPIFPDQIEQSKCAEDGECEEGSLCCPNSCGPFNVCLPEVEGNTVLPVMSNEGTVDIDIYHEDSEDNSNSDYVGKNEDGEEDYEYVKEYGREETDKNTPIDGEYNGEEAKEYEPGKTKVYPPASFKKNSLSHIRSGWSSGLGPLQYDSDSYEDDDYYDNEYPFQSNEDTARKNSSDNDHENKFDDDGNIEEEYGENSDAGFFDDWDFNPGTEQNNDLDENEQDDLSTEGESNEISTDDNFGSEENGPTLVDLNKNVDWDLQEEDFEEQTGINEVVISQPVLKLIHSLLKESENSSKSIFVLPAPMLPGEEFSMEYVRTTEKIRFTRKHANKTSAP